MWQRALSGSGGGESGMDFTPLIPRMTGNSSPSGVGTASSNSHDPYGAYDAWNAFDRTIGTTGWTADYNVKPAYVAFTFPTAQKAKATGIQFNAIGSMTTTPLVFTVQASNDNWNTVKNLTEELSIVIGTDGPLQVIPFTKNVGDYTSYRWYFTSYTTINGNNFAPMKIQLYS